jgi:poly-gamma-glutamate capsule biosynthesis protein CapA/YwtB (metallophosphatase superfamily)
LCAVASQRPAHAQRPVAADPDAVVMSFAGDVAWPDGKNDFGEMRARGAALFDQVRGLLERSDLAFANIECPITARATVASKTYPFRCQPETLQWVIGGGLNMLSLANNHARDAGLPGLVDTLELLERTTTAERPLYWAGTGRTAEDARKPVIFTVPGKQLTVAFFAVANAGGAGGGPVDGLWDKTLPARIAAARQQADVVIVSSHGGPEYEHAPTADFARRYRELIDAGAALIVGHHPHVVQGVERHGDGFIFYSLGNFSFGSITSRHLATGARMYSLIARVKFKDKKLHRIELVPLYANNGSRWTLGDKTVEARLGVPQLLSGPFAQYALDELEAFSRAVPGAGPTALTRLGDRFYVDLGEGLCTDEKTAAILLRRQASDWAAITALGVEPRAATEAEMQSKTRAGTPARAEPPARSPRGRGKGRAAEGSPGPRAKPSGRATKAGRPAPSRQRPD